MFRHHSAAKGNGAASSRRWLLGGVLGLLLAAPAAAQFIHDSVPGGLVAMPLADAGQPRPQAWFGQRQVVTMRFAGRWSALVGLPMSTLPGGYVVQVRPPDAAAPIDHEFIVYPERMESRARVTQPGPPAAARDMEFVWREPLEAKLPLDSPVPLPAQPSFGGFLAGADHRYADFITFTLTRDRPVQTPAAGRVAAVISAARGDYLWIDHGMSVYTRIGPLTVTLVAEAEQLEPGQRIGGVRLGEDQSSRALYLSVFLNGAAVKPSLIFDLQQAEASVQPNG